jgi:hypothetical protein
LAAETAVTSTKSFLKTTLLDLDTSSKRFPTRRVKQLTRDLFYQIHVDILSIYPSLSTTQIDNQLVELKKTKDDIFYYLTDKNQVIIHDFGTTGI